MYFNWTGPVRVPAPCLVSQLRMSASYVKPGNYFENIAQQNWTNPVFLLFQYAHKIAGMAGEYLKKSPDRMNPDLLFYI